MDNKELDALVKRIQDTVGFTTAPSKNGVKVTAESSGKSAVVHTKSPSDSHTLKNTRTRLRRIGWTDDLYEQQNRKARESRVARARAEQQPHLAAVDDQPPPSGDGASGELQVTVETIDPDTARQYLEHIEDNTRPVAQYLINYLAAVISRGEWVLTHQGIAFNTNGNLADGKHRLYAIVAAGTPCTMMVTRGMPPDRFTAMDIGKRRSASDMLAVAGEPHSIVLAGTLRHLLLYETADVAEWRRARISPDQLLDTLQRHPGARESAKAGQGMTKVRLSPTAAATAHYLIHQAWPDAPVDDWYAQLRSGANFAPGAPGLKLRNYALTARERPATPAERRTLKSVLHMALLIRAWNDSWTGETWTGVTWREGDTIPAPILGGTVQGHTA